MQRRSSLGVSSRVLCALGLVGACSAPGEPIGELSQELSVYEVGLGKAYPSLQAVANLLNPGDTVEVYGGATYSGDIRLTRSGTPSSKIRIVGVRVDGARPVLSGGTNTIEFAANHYSFEGFEVTRGSSRCVFHHGDDITIRDTVVHDCPAHGILGADTGSGSLTLEYSEVHHCGSGDRLHQVYMATDETAYPGSVFRMRHCYVHDGNGGNNVKSRAERNEIHYNWIEGAYYHELELIGPDGQAESLKREDSDVVGNVLYQGYGTRSHYAIRIGGDGTGQTFGRYRFVNNTIVVGTASTSAVFRVFDGIESVEMHNNALYRQGGGPVTVLRDAEARWLNGPVIAGSNNWVTSGSVSIPVSWTGTRQGATPGFVDTAGRELDLLSTSPLRDAGTSTLASAPGYAFPSPEPSAAYEPPRHVLLAVGSAVPRVISGAVDIGSFEYGNTGEPAPAPTTEPTTEPLPPPPPPPTSTPQTLRPVEDTFVRGGSFAGTNYGSATVLHVKSNSDLSYTRDSYLKFDVGTMPSVSAAKFRMYADLTESGSVTTSIYPMTGKVWSEATTTWNSRPGFISTPLGSITVTGTAHIWYEIDVTTYVQSEYTAGRRLVSFALHCPAPSVPRINLNSREAGSNMPELVVTP